MFLVRVEAYLRIVVVTLLVLTFGVLRLYNSQVANTRFLIKLRETMVKLVNEIPGIERLLKQSNSSLSQTNNKIESLDKTLERLHSKKNED
jgi:septal ring factor EnvC (AmiA/AmiB activator)